MEPARSLLVAGDDVDFLITGVGLVEASYSLSRYLSFSSSKIQAVINFGVGGAFVSSAAAGLLDLCLARQEVLADLGICINGRVVPFAADKLDVATSFFLPVDLSTQAEKILAADNFFCKKGTFVTVNCVSGTRQRGDELARIHHGLCENMEGAAVARVCQGFRIPLIEIRCISNLVVDRDPSSWRLRDACRKCGEAAACLVRGLMIT